MKYWVFLPNKGEWKTFNSLIAAKLYCLINSHKLIAKSK